MRKLIWHSNAPWAPTGYGQQTALFAPLVAQHYELGISSFYGLEGASIKWHDLPVLPGVGGEYGNGPLPEHAARFFGGDPRGGIVFTLMDVWVLDPAMARGLNMACWTPVDHQPVPPKVVEFFVASGAVPVAMSRFGQLELGRLDPLYCPHGVDCEAYRPLPGIREQVGAFPKDAFVIGMVAANKGRPSRKGFSQALQAFARFSERHDNAYLYLHTTLDPNYGQGENLPALVEALGISMDRVRIADQYRMMHSPYSQRDMAKVYAALDVLLNPSWGEGFGIPVLEAQACGTPAIVTDFSAMREVCAAGWHVEHAANWSALGSWQAIPDVDSITDALEECHALPAKQRYALARKARKHALGYHSDLVFREHMLPALKIIEQRFDARAPVHVPSRLKVAA